LVCAVMPQGFIDQHGGVVVENHLNVIRAGTLPVVGPDTIATILNSRALDRAFRCINGSVAVSAYELEALPLPSPSQAKAVERMLLRGASRAAIKAKIASFYLETPA
jgi:adenine-specific DNA-methyltransferase